MTIPVGFAQVTHNIGGTAMAHPAAVVYGVDIVGAATPDEAAETAHGLYTDFIMKWATAATSLESTLVKFGPDATGPSGIFAADEPGLVAGAGSPSNCAYLIRKNSALGGRRGRGRMYVPGVAESQVGDDGDLDNSFASDFQDDINNFWLALGLANMPMVILHDDATSPTPVTSLVLQAQIATQRRRLRR